MKFTIILSHSKRYKNTLTYQPFDRYIYIYLYIYSIRAIEASQFFVGCCCKYEFSWRKIKKEKEKLEKKNIILMMMT